MGRNRSAGRAVSVGRNKKKTGRSFAAKAKNARGLTPIRKNGRAPGRNTPCPCASGKKFKHCHGKTVPAPAQLAYQTLQDLYSPEQLAEMQEFLKYFGFHPNPQQLKMFMEDDIEGLVAQIVAAMQTTGADPKFIYAVKQLNGLVTPKNRHLLDKEELNLWDTTVKAYENECRGIESGGTACVDTGIRPPPGQNPIEDGQVARAASPGSECGDAAAGDDG